ncbi:hypothetical protein HDU96_001070 [Phlyctochytrium bullatum]|nr:hypothetical protein HDU96_001070 [Phlyctochytrium bullatum]
MLVLTGSSALSSFRRDRILQGLQSRLPGSSRIVGIAGYYVHLVAPGTDASASSSPEVRRILDILLDYGTNEARTIPASDRAHLTAIATSGKLASSGASQGNTTLVAVFPRAGTISPWSSKATDIARTCTLTAAQVGRIERGIVYLITTADGPLLPEHLPRIADDLHDRMTEALHLGSLPAAVEVFGEDGAKPRPLKHVDMVSKSDKTAAREALEKANREWGLALAEDEMEYLTDAFLNPNPSVKMVKRDPTDVELMMFAQVNSEHCRHKIFRATWTIDSQDYQVSLFDMIRNTYKLHPNRIISAYSDNAAVLEGPTAQYLTTGPAHSWKYSMMKEPVHSLAKVETHNHPTAVSPFPGAATGSGGEIRDEGAVGQGSHPKTGLTGFTVSHLRIPGYEQPWETSSADLGKPDHVSSALDIMIQAPLGGAAFNNEFGRPNICGYFRTFLEKVPAPRGEDGSERYEWRGYHKPIMIAGGTGSVRPMHVGKQPIPPGALLVVLGGPSMLIGLGGGAASSMAQGSSTADLDFASVQRDNAEIQRRAQMVLDACNSLGDATPLLAVHDVGAGGLSNALPELVHDSGRGAQIDLAEVPCADPTLSPMELWCNESQERYVMAISADRREDFAALCARERCPFAVVGVATEEERLVVKDSRVQPVITPIDLPMETLFGKPPRMHRVATTVTAPRTPVSVPATESLEDVATRVLRFPAVGSKSFLITIGDRTVSGLVGRDQMVGPWQIPVADVSVTLTSHFEQTGEAMAMGERTPLALLNAAASARMAVAESLLNLLAAPVRSLSTVRLSANWMSAASHEGEGSRLYEAVKAVGMDLCPKLGVTIPVGKDSMSMKTKWKDSRSGEAKEVTAPLSLIITAYAPVEDSSATSTPELKGRSAQGEPTVLVLVDLAEGKMRLGGSAVGQVYNQIGASSPDVENPELLKGIWKAFDEIRSGSTISILSYHDRSDGGLFTTVLEMCMAGHAGCSIDLSGYLGGKNTNADLIKALFNEELGVVVEIPASQVQAFKDTLKKHGVDSAFVHQLGNVQPSPSSCIEVTLGNSVVLRKGRASLHRLWAETSYRMQALRGNPELSRAEYDTILDVLDPGISAALTFNSSDLVPRPISTAVAAPKVALLREQGINSYQELSFAFYSAGFEVHDVHMTDLLSGRVQLASFHGLGLPGGFSYGDVLGAGSGWAKSVLQNPVARKELATFFERTDTFCIGICNGCQALTQLRDIIPGAESWPRFVKNRSEMFEARVCTLEVVLDEQTAKTSAFFDGMVGSRIPIAVAHGEGQAEFVGADVGAAAEALLAAPAGPAGAIALRYVDNYGSPAGPERYPFNPNGSPLGLAGVVNGGSNPGRILALMPHPERYVGTAANTWALPYKERVKGQGALGPWFKLFLNARAWVDKKRNVNGN